jgi:hypothetical protein
VYGQGFAIYALSEYPLGTGDKRGLDYASRTFALLQKCCSDTWHGGVPDIAFRLSLRRRHPGGFALSRLDTRPARTPVNASPTPSRAPTHDSGPLWPARPSTYDFSIHCTLPV